MDYVPVRMGRQTITSDPTNKKNKTTEKSPPKHQQDLYPTTPISIIPELTLPPNNNNNSEHDHFYDPSKRKLTWNKKTYTFPDYNNTQNKKTVKIH